MNETTETDLNRDTAIKTIRDSLKTRSGKVWSVTGGKGTAWGWITITAPPARRGDFGYMSDADRTELAELLGTDVHCQGVLVPASNDYRREFIDRAAGREPAVIAAPYWD